MKKYLSMEQKYYCPECGHEFVQGESNYNYDTAKLDFHCPECDWEGNEDGVCDEEYEELKIWDGCYNQRTLKKEGLEIITWPDSQLLIDTHGYRKHSWLINDERGLNRFGSSAYVVEINWYHENVMNWGLR